MPTGHIPTQSAERIGSLDFLRGIAVLGILIINIESFSYPNPFNPYQFGFADPLDTSVRFWVYFLCQGKFFGIFALLFGVGFYMFLNRQETKGTGLSGLDLYARRLGWLFVFGLVHSYLLWDGDILYHYAVCGFLLFPFRALNSRQILFVIGILAVLLLYDSYSRIQNQHKTDVKALSRPAELSEEETAPVGSWIKIYEPVLQARKGSFLDNLIQNAAHTKVHQGEIFYRGLLFRTLIMMMLGIVLYKNNIFQDYHSLKYYWPLSLSLLIIGIFMNYSRYYHWTYEYSQPVTNIWTGWWFTFPKEVLALAYVLVLNGLYQMLLKYLPIRAITSAGRMALTNYLFQSIICIFVFFGYGWSMYNAWSRSTLLIVVLVIWFLQLTISWLWMKRFAYGPMEWLWRSLTYGNIRLNQSLGTKDLKR